MYLAGLAGGVCKKQGYIHRCIFNSDYYAFLIHEGEFQPSILTGIGFIKITSSFRIRNSLYRPL
jgi:hypothetical protein